MRNFDWWSVIYKERIVPFLNGWINGSKMKFIRLNIGEMCGK